MATLHKIAPGGITAHAWNKDRTMIALCPNSSSVHIYKVKDPKNAKSAWELVHDLKEHDQVVTGIDWAPKSNKLVTASQDRNAYVWNLETVDGKETWMPNLVILRVTRGATAVRWTQDEKKFAVGSGARAVPVCYYEEDNNWWVSKLIKKHKSTILDLSWHPTAPLLATASSDFKCRIFSAFVKGVDKKDKIAESPWKKDDGKLGFGDVMHELTCAGWVHSVRWSPSGSTLAFAGHDSSVSFVAVAANGPDSTCQVVKMSCLPFRSLMFLSDTALVGAGHELNPRVFQLDGEWEMKGKLDKKVEKEVAEQSSAKAAFAVFQNQAKKGTKDVSDDTLATKHQNSISALVPYSAPGSDVTAFTSSGLDGSVVYWELGSLESAMASLSL